MNCGLPTQQGSAQQLRSTNRPGHQSTCEPHRHAFTAQEARHTSIYIYYGVQIQEQVTLANGGRRQNSALLIWVEGMNWKGQGGLAGSWNVPDLHVGVGDKSVFAL